jgi:flagellar motility protein MotE (MotC chaperone)
MMLNALQYAPLVMEVTKAMGGKPEEAPETTPDELKGQLQAQQKRIEETQEEVSRLRDRMRQLESAVSTLQLWAWIGLTSLGILVVIMLIVMLTRR